MSSSLNLLLLVIAAAVLSSIAAFQSAVPGMSTRSHSFLSVPQRLVLQNSMFDEDQDEEDEDDDMIDLDSLGDWRDFRRNLAVVAPGDTSEEKQVKATKSVSLENEQVLKSQSSELAAEYTTGVWCHVTSTPEVGGLVVRLPLEAEIYRNFKHTMTGRKLRKSSKSIETASTALWYKMAGRLIEEEMFKIADEAGDDGQIDATGLSDQFAELLQLYLGNQETWQEVCLVLDRDETDGTATTLVLNRPMAFKLTENLGQLVLQGAFHTGNGASRKVEPKSDLVQFMLAFGQECAVYVGGPDLQDQPAEIIHGIEGLSGAVEISPGAKIYRGGVDAAIDGVLRGLYSPLDFRFFVGCHTFDESTLDVSVVLGKYQPIACARTVALKQCISLPKPLYHEVLELCGGEMEELSRLEMLKRDDIQFQIIDEDEFDGDDDDDLPNELGELETFDDEDDDYL